MRRWGVTHEGEGTWWPSIGRNKRSVVADLRTPAGRELLLRIAAQADVVLENFRPGRLAEFGLDYEALRARNPGVVLVHVSGLRADGPALGRGWLRLHRRGGGRDPAHHR